MDRYIQFGLVVARQALDQAGLPARMEGALAERTGVYLGSGLGGVATHVRQRPAHGRARPGPDLAVLRPDGHRERRLRPGRDRVRHARPELRDRVRLRDRRPRDRRGLGDDPPRRRRHHARRRLRGRDPRGGGRRVRVDEGPLDPQRRSRGGLPPVRHGTRRLRHRRGCRDAGPRGALARRAARRGAARRARRLRRDRGRLAHHAAGAGRGRARVRAGRRALEKAGMDAGRDRPRQRPRDLDAGGRPRGAPGARDAARRARAGGLDLGAEVDARPHARRGRARSSRSRRSRRCATARSRRRSTSQSPDPNASTAST